LNITIKRAIAAEIGKEEPKAAKEFGHSTVYQ
jgi:hypothetical protein